MNWAEAGQLVVLIVLWIAASAFVALVILSLSSYVGRKLADARERDSVHLPRNPMKYEGRDLTPAQLKRAREVEAVDQEDFPIPFALDEPSQPRRRA